MYRHRKSHKEYQEIQEQEIKITKNTEQHKQKLKSRLKCPKCDDHLKSYQHLDDHLAQNHEINIEEEYLEFENEEEFLTWKSNVEKETQAQYCSIRGARKRKNYSVREYICHRSYNKKVNPTKRKKAAKRLGSNKIGAACPSRMIVKCTVEKVIVNFTRIHVGHSNEVIRMRLPSHQRAAIAEKLRNGFTVKRILDDVRNADNSDHFERLQYLKRRDIYNIIRDHNIGHVTRFHKDDVINVDLLVTSLCQQEDSPILHYNLDSENFCLIIMTPYQKCMLLEYLSKVCVDVTHGLNAYGCELVSIIVTDEFNNGIPVAFCFTKKIDLDTITLFYSKIKESIGLDYDVKTQVFMSNDAPQFYDAWASVFGKADYKLSCWWHISKNWVNNLNSKIDDKDKRKMIKNTLFTLATSIQNENEFESELTKLLADLRADPVTLPFHDYFQSYYVAKKTSWAFCFRKHIGINIINTHLESLHKKIKQIYLDREQGPRLDKAINTLFKLIRDSMYDRIIKIVKNRPSEKIRKIKVAHSRRVEIPDEDIVCVNQREIWNVKSQKNREFDYEVKRISNNCQCVLQCSECDICVHTYQCSCVDNVIYLNICKHIHKIAENSRIDSVEKLSRCAIEVHENLLLSEAHPKLAAKSEENNVSKRKEELCNRLQFILELTSTLSEEEIEFTSKTLDEIIQKINSR